ncbi:YkgJ family cysteine cluster protein [Chondromyces crocatus]|uniref:YkgJ family cysteine cluster protein n=1 Tax=Chondromyces crocatus TaxID=52 RepID=A0A0K1EC94_CHOCO|nr:YkgJ family cysteine cluster protein [Chondromyces crocatus]AKT38302.1 uncharacterized protein CMC5_024470 [Chondromyces crocatus]
MEGQGVHRPVWRRFKERFLERAVAHVHAGGHAVVVRDAGQVEVLLGVDASGSVTALGLWALLAIGQRRWARVEAGAARGLASAVVGARQVGSVLDWCDRDGVHEGATREILLDCLACAACCRDGRVVLDDEDLARFEAAGRAELGGSVFVRRAGGKAVLRLASDGRCKHLEEERRCAIYAIRPGNCRAFLMGSEACLAAREETLGLRDGAPLEG